MPRFRRRYRPRFRRRYGGRGFLGLRHRTLRQLRNLLCTLLVVGAIAGGVFFILDRQEANPSTGLVVATPSTGVEADARTEATESQSRYPNGASLDPREIELAVVKYTNEERVHAGLGKLQERDAISLIARAHSENMVKLGFEHDLAGKGPTDRAIDAGLTCLWVDGSIGLSENIYMYNRVGLWLGDRPVEYEKDADAMGRSLVNGWMESPGHRQNILDRAIRLIGVGIAIDEDRERHTIDEIAYATQNFSGCSP